MLFNDKRLYLLKNDNSKSHVTSIDTLELRFMLVFLALLLWITFQPNQMKCSTWLLQDTLEEF